MSELTIAVNVSAQQFKQADFVDSVRRILFEYGADAAKLKLELTESMLVDNVDEVIAKITQLKTSGVGFSLDDFGTGYSSLAYLQRLPLDQLKIDQSFVRDLHNNPNDAVIARSIINLAHSLNLSVIAEGVENAEQYNFLLAHGCNLFQGYMFSPAVHAEQLQEWIQARPSVVAAVAPL